MKHHEILQFLKTVDSELVKYADEGETLEFHLIGRSALILRYGLSLMTKDVDIVQFHGRKLENKAIEFFGKGTSNAKRLGFYLEQVPRGYRQSPAAIATDQKIFRASGKSSDPSCQIQTTWLSQS